NPALAFAALNYLAMKDGKNIAVIMPYADSLKYMADWYAQLWAESIGKKFDREGNIIHTGSTPVKALGTTDQHSQLQLYSEGPNDKIIIFLGVKNYREDITIPKIYEEIPSLSFLGGHTHSKLIQTEQLATEYALLKAGKQNMTITLESVNEESIGGLIYFFELATAYAGEFLNINAFDQPGVEESKNATYALFDRPGYEEKKKEILSAPKKKLEYAI
ncbi:MAG: glucose-6-phosphate isomerase, partial [Defluviitaleaceae bacterium]|nr:glucose-6-phosphate isomerase [Defluviitaleaceae bacterium]